MRVVVAVDVSIVVVALRPVVPQFDLFQIRILAPVVLMQLRSLQSVANHSNIDQNPIVLPIRANPLVMHSNAMHCQLLQIHRRRPLGRIDHGVRVHSAVLDDV